MNRKLKNELLSMDRAKLEEQYSYLIGQAERYENLAMEVLKILCCPC